jgi:phosphopantothenate synthetase
MERDGIQLQTIPVKKPLLSRLKLELAKENAIRIEKGLTEIKGQGEYIDHILCEKFNIENPGK